MSGCPCRLHSRGMDRRETEASPAEPRRARSKRRVWEDPDDPSLVVPVAGQPRARRLRETEDERELAGAHGWGTEWLTLEIPCKATPCFVLLRDPLLSLLLASSYGRG